MLRGRFLFKVVSRPRILTLVSKRIFGRMAEARKKGFIATLTLTAAKILNMVHNPRYPISLPFHPLKRLITPTFPLTSGRPKVFDLNLLAP